MNISDRYKEAQQLFYKKEGVSPVSKYVKLDGGVKNVHYLEVGQGKPLILIHGGGGNTDQWVNIIRHLQSEFKLYIVDRPGCGLTDPFNYRGVDYKEHCVSFLAAFMDALNIPKADFAANSMGAYWTALLAIEHPEKVNKLVFLGAPAGLALELPFFLRLLGVRGVNDLLWATIAKPSLAGTKKLHEMLLVACSQKLSEEYLSCSYLGSILPHYKIGWLTMLENITTLRGFRKDYFIGDKIHNILNSTLFLWGDKDAFQGSAHGEKIAKQMKSSDFIALENAGHLPWLDQPEICASAMSKFLL